MSIDLATLVDPVRRIAQEAGRRILEIYYGGFTVTAKADLSPVTEADLAAHQTIAQGLTALDPAIPLLSEEACNIDFAERSRWEWLWLVDPLDGTKEFIKRCDQFSINIALIRRHSPLFGLILMPVTGLCYFAYAGGGAFKQCPGQAPLPIHTRPVGRRPLRVTGSRSYSSRALQKHLYFLGRYHYVGVGSALKSCLVAEGKMDFYPRFGPTYEWDTAAAQVIVEEAGGRVTDTRLKPLRYNARPSLINPDFLVFGDPSHDWSRYLPRRAPEKSL